MFFPDKSGKNIPCVFYRGLKPSIKDKNSLCLDFMDRLKLMFSGRDRKTLKPYNWYF